MTGRQSPTPSELARLFSRRTYRALAHDTHPGDREWAIEVLSSLGDPRRSTVSELFDVALSIMESQYPNEYVYKNRVLRKQMLGRYKPSTASARTEFRVGNSVADILISHRVSSIFEVKTDLDDFSRLDSQLRDYRGFAPLVTIVTSGKRIAGLEGRVPESVGLSIFGPRGRISVARVAQLSWADVDPLVVFASLQREDQRQILSSELGLDSTRFSWAERREAFSHLDGATASLAATKLMKDRGIRSYAASKILGQVPSSMITLAFSETLSPKAAQLLSRRLMSTPHSLE